jgi:hypothetical protein
MLILRTDKQKGRNAPKYERGKIPSIQGPAENKAESDWAPEASRRIHSKAIAQPVPELKTLYSKQCHSFRRNPGILLEPAQCC